MSVDPNAAKTASLATFLTALVTNGAVFAVEIALFTILRNKFRVIYSPRTYIPVEGKRAEPLSAPLLSWPTAIYKLDHDDIRRQNGLDAYVFVRFLRMMAIMLLPIWIVSWAVLLPVNAIASTNGFTGLDRFTLGNIKNTNSPRYAAHLVLAWIFTFWIFYVIKGEMRHFITVRQRHLVDPAHAKSAQASTILVTGIPPRYLHVSALRSLYSTLPGGVHKVWVNRNLKDIPDLFDERLAAINKLESAEVKLMNIAATLELKRQEALAKGKEPKVVDSPADSDPERPLALAEKLVPRGERPMHRLKPSWAPFALPFLGPKVDTIEWCREEIPRLNQQVVERQNAFNAEMGTEIHEPGTEETYPRLTSAFVQFNQQVGAHLAAQALNHHEPYRMGERFTDVAPEDIVWSNLNLNPYEAKIRTAISYSATAALIIFWAIPVVFVGVISNIKALSAKYAWLHWLNKLPSVVIGIISGILPPVLLAVLFMLLPIVLRLLAQFEGIPRRTGIELSLMTRFFIFQVIHGFLIVSLSSGIIAALSQLIAHPSDTPTLLATNLPKASTFFLTYILLQLSGVAGGFLQIVPLIVYYVKLILLGSTPRSVYSIKNVMRSVQWGTLFPNISLIMVVTIAYSVISPIINGLACVMFFLLYQLWKYLFLYQLDQPPSGDTGGLFFPKAITHVFVGLYVEQICLAALFFLARDNKDKASAIPQGALMIVLIIITIGYHVVITDSYGPLLHSLPLSLVDRSIQEGEVPSSDDGEKSEHASKGAATGRAPVGADIESTTRNRFTAPKSSDDEHDSTKGATAERAQALAGPVDFTHPALGPARIAWIPRDTLGLTDEELAANRAAGIEVSDAHAVMNEKGKVDVSSYPPGEKPREG